MIKQQNTARIAEQGWMVNKMSDTIDRQTTIKKGEKICPKCGRLLMEWIEDDT